MGFHPSKRGALPTLLLSMLTVSSCSILPESFNSATNAFSKRASKKTTVPLTSDGGFWFANVSVGDGSSMNLLIDTGSTDVVLNPGKYKPSDASVNGNETFTLSYGTAESNGTGTATINGTVYHDTVTLGGLKVENQTIGVSNSTDSSTEYPHDGIIGFGAQQFAANNATSYFHNLCEENLVDDCRFGIALDNATAGSFVIGTLDDDLFDGDLTTSPLVEEWFTYGDVVVGGQTLEGDAIIEFDSGSAAIVGPTDVVTKIFDSVGARISSEETSEGLLLTAQVACDVNSTVGFRFPSSNTFNISLGALLVPSTNASDPNCTISLVAQDFPDLPGLWVLGQTFFQGKYLDHNLDDQTIGIATLKTSANSSSSGSESGSGSGGDSGSSSNAATSLSFGINLLLCILAVMLGVSML
ncbi:uncharacterized protein Z518_03786 [Rhinocladiella mackenziei CBS 650.93]|uniref:Rhinocladiella mackenziei CBS 650.93 unplaced genomic scaffold supercont1.3, whole genome shotgun sequence n=1 Tax=Rhinocladiella mackenziei CBS 650.93 TaxID=1442369 RepID=A0A0D2IJA9_9EURO|nr:uncharacterized protein Z518_03786 [Rhinocladiella mackenziei CBS 650.93]KIX05814.1 hypothetical protein Z518_03786 [Rhinocladiella mackenziei CBS 650.93]